MLNIKMVKPKPKQYKIAYASLNYSKKKKPKTVTRSITVAKKEPKDKFDIIIDKAIMKGLLDESERDIKKAELSILTAQDLANYEQEVNSADAIEFLNTDIDLNSVQDISAQDIMKDMDKAESLSMDMDEATKALHRIKADGPIIGDFSKIEIPHNDVSSGFGDDSPRSLADIKAERAYQRELQAAQANITEDGQGGYTKSFDETSLLEDSLATLKLNKTANAKPKSTMTNFKGLTQPIVQHINNTSDNPMANLNSLFSDMNWSRGHR